MKYKKVTIATTTAAEDIVSAGLYELGVTGVCIENKVALNEGEIGDMFIDFPLDLGEDDGRSSVIFYLEDDSELLPDIERMLNDLAQTFDIGEGTVTVSVVDDADWIDKWKDFFHGFAIGDIYIHPGWENGDIPGEYTHVIEIDPGVSFGTGKHETTYMCLEALQKHVREGVRVLDAGCGSGILSIAALKLGAVSAAGYDIDENCITSSCRNLEKNISDPGLYRFERLNLLEDEGLEKALRDAPEGGYSIIVANILADVIIPMLGAFKKLLKKGGVLILSGIIDFKEDEVRAALDKEGFRTDEINHMGEWVECTSFS